jgi:hypothetical protein
MHYSITLYGGVEVKLHPTDEQIDMLSSVYNHTVHNSQGMHNNRWKYLHIMNVCDVKLHVQETPFFIIFLIYLMTM